MELDEIKDVVTYSDIWNISGKEQRLNDEIGKGIRKMYVLTDNMLSLGGISVTFDSINERTIKEQRVYIEKDIKYNLWIGHIATVLFIIPTTLN